MPSNPDTELRRLLLKTQDLCSSVTGRIRSQASADGSDQSGGKWPADASRCARWLWEDQPSD